MIKSMNHNFLVCYITAIGLDVKSEKSPNAQDAFLPIPGVISCAGVTGSGRITCHAHICSIWWVCMKWGREGAREGGREDAKCMMWGCEM